MTEKIYIGRRKTSVARLIVKSGSGKVTINGREFDKYFTQDIHRNDILSPFALTGESGKYDLSANLSGGGLTGQSQALRLAISRALVDFTPEFRTKLKPEGMLRRDPRMVERKKYGRPKARKRFQFSKR